MKLIAMTISAAIISTQAFAACMGSGNLSTCYDSSGNNYTVNRMGNSTFMQGSNSRTGSNWSQQSTTFGNTTIHNGRDSNGDHWNTTCFNGVCN